VPAVSREVCHFLVLSVQPCPQKKDMLRVQVGAKLWREKEIIFVTLRVLIRDLLYSISLAYTEYACS
jgi:hypothetical protein